MVEDLHFVPIGWSVHSYYSILTIVRRVQYIGFWQKEWAYSFHRGITWNRTILPEHMTLILLHDHGMALPCHLSAEICL